MNQKILERRRYLIKNLSTGLPLADVVKETAVLFKVSTRAIYYDYRRHKNWLPYVLEIQDPERFLMDLLATHREIMDKAKLEYLKADNSAARIGALRLQRDLNKDFHEMIITKNFMIQRKRIATVL